MLNTSVVRRTTTAALALALSVGLMACNPPKAPVANAVTSVTATPEKLALNLTTTKTGQITTTVVVTGTAAKTVSFTSRNTAVATVAAGTTAGTATVTAVAAGVAIIDVCSTVATFTTKCDTVEVTVTGGTTGGTLTPAVSINFQPAAFTPTPTGFTANTGAAYDTTTGIGWVTEASAGTTALVGQDMTANTRDRSTSSSKVAGLTPEQYTQVNMQCAKPPTSVGGNACASGTQVPGAFEYKVVNGTYTVTVNVGESTTTDFNSIMALNVEGTNFVTNFTPSSATPFSMVTKDVKVTDGSLTVDAKTGINTKIQYLKIAPAAVQQ